MTTASKGKGGIDRQAISFKSVNDTTYKGIVLENYNATKAILIAASQDKFAKERVAACYLAVNSLANMVLPFVSDDPNKPIVMSIKTEILDRLSGLESEYDDIWIMNVQERAKYVMNAERVLSNLPPLFSFIGLYVRTTAKGVFKYPEKSDKL